MKEMQLFEVGFKSKFSNSGYWDKVYVATTDDLGARGLSRRWIEKIHGNEDALEDLNEDEIEEYLEEIASLKVVRIHHVGQVVID